MRSHVGHKYGRAHKELLVWGREECSTYSVSVCGACSYLMRCEKRFRPCHCSSSKTGLRCRFERGQFGSRDECALLPHCTVIEYHTQPDWSKSQNAWWCNFFFTSLRGCAREKTLVYKVYKIHCTYILYNIDIIHFITLFFCFFKRN